MADNDDYTETLGVPVSWWLIGAVFALAVFWAFYVATPLVVAALAGIIAVTLVVAMLSRYGAATLSTEPSGFSAGRALLPYRFIGTVEPLDAEATRRALGVDADARAYLLVRSYCGGAVKVVVDDPADPTPYWIVSTRHPAALAEGLALRAMQD